MHKARPKDNLSQDVWIFDNPTPGQRERTSEANWVIPLSDGSLLTDPAHSVLLAELQQFVASAFYEPDEGLRMSAGSISGTLNSLGVLASFMADNDLRTVSHFTSEVSWKFVEYVEDHYEDDGFGNGRPRELTHSSAYRLLLPLSQLFSQRKAMAARGVGFVEEAPFDGRSVYDVVVNDLGLPRDGKLLPIPDKVSIPTLSRAFKCISIGAADVLKLQAEFLECYERLPYQQANEAARDLILNFEFAIDSQTGRPWHKRIEPSKREMLDGREVELSIIQGFRRLILEMVTACTICIQGATGIRAHELLSLKSGKSDSNPFPNCIHSRLSADGLMELLFIEGITAKRTIAATEWLIGSRPIGSNSTPAPAMAINVLQDLLEPWRVLGGYKSLLVNFSAARGVPRAKSSISLLTSCSLTYMQKEFAVSACYEHGEMDVEEAVRQGRIIRSHRWRPTFAQFVFRTSPKLLIPLRDHFKHISEAVTDAGYVGNDASLLEDLESERVQETARMLVEISMGKAVGAGSVRHLIDRFGESLAQEMSSLPGDTPYDRAVSFVYQHDIRIWNSSYAACFMNILPQASKCNDMRGLPFSVRSQPDYGLRSPSVCASCKCCWIRTEHRGFWEERLSRNSAISSDERQRSVLGEWSIAARRVNQSSAILRSIDASAKKRSVDVA